MADPKNEQVRRRVLCVIPDSDTFELLRVQLLDLCPCYKADHVRGSNAALEAAHTGDYDLYILDNWWLDDGDGIALCREIRRKDATTPILFYSGNASPSEIAKALDAGAQAYIPLPDASDELPRRVDQLLDGRK